MSRPTPPLPILFIIYFLAFTFCCSSLAYGTPQRRLHSPTSLISSSSRFLQSRREAAEMIVKNTDLILAESRTTRKDPTNNFRYYNGGWNISNQHYWAVSFHILILMLSSSVYLLIKFLPVAVCWIHRCPLVCHRLSVVRSVRPLLVLHLLFLLLLSARTLWLFTSSLRSLSYHPHPLHYLRNVRTLHYTLLLQPIIKNSFFFFLLASFWPNYDCPVLLVSVALFSTPARVISTRRLPVPCLTLSPKLMSLLRSSEMFHTTWMLLRESLSIHRYCPVMYSLTLTTLIGKSILPQLF